MLNKLFNMFNTTTDKTETSRQDTPSEHNIVNDGVANFIQLYGHLSINQLISDWQEIPLTPEDQVWVGFPPTDFIDFVRSYPRTPFDSIPPSANYLKEPSFLVSQAHRIWLTTSLVDSHLKRLNAKNFLDLGSFPFFASLVLRDYFGFNGDITVTTNIELSEEGYAFLKSRNISIQKLDLDPLVSDPESSAARLPASLNFPDGSFDVILSSHVIEHLYHPKKMISECARLLRPDGCIVVTTDNAMMVDVFANYIGGYGYTFEPVQHTAAMHFDFWRGHVRFFTSKDLQILLENSGFSVVDVDYFHCFYDVLFDEYFKSPSPRLAGWKIRMLAETPWLRNDVAVVARKAENTHAG
jgi:SAM-dependent methyltransferase